MDSSGPLLQHAAHCNVQYQWICPSAGSESEFYSVSSPETVSPPTSMGDCLSPCYLQPWNPARRVRTSNSDVLELSPSPTGPGRRSGRSRRRVRSKQRESASEKEKMRMRDLTKALHHLRTYLPPSVAPAGQTLTKIEILRLTIRYISSLSDQLEFQEQNRGESTCHAETDIQCSLDVDQSGQYDQAGRYDHSGRYDHLGRYDHSGHWQGRSHFAAVKNQNPNLATTGRSVGCCGVRNICEAHQTDVFSAAVVPVQPPLQADTPTLQLYEDFCSQLVPGELWS